MGSITTKIKNRAVHFFRNLRPQGFFILCVLLGILGLGIAPTHVQAEVVIPTPSWMEKVEVADKMIINGLPSTVHYFNSDKGLDELLRFYRQRWDSGDKKKPGYREVEFAPWHIISRLEDDKRYLLTVQARSAGPLASHGYLAIADLKGMKNKSDRGSGIPKIKDSRIVNDLTSFDPGKKGRTVLVVNNYSVASNSEYYRKYYGGRGWGKSIDIEKDGSQVLAFTRFGKEVNVVISQNFGSSTQVVMNIVEDN